MMVFLVIITIADILTTNLGIGIGRSELNIFVLSIGLELWGIFRIGLLAFVASVFFLGYRYCYKHSIYSALTGLKICLLTVDLYLAIVVISNAYVLLRVV